MKAKFIGMCLGLSALVIGCGSVANEAEVTATAASSVTCDLPKAMAALQVARPAGWVSDYRVESIGAEGRDERRLLNRTATFMKADC